MSRVSFVLSLTAVATDYPHLYSNLNTVSSDFKVAFPPNLKIVSMGSCSTTERREIKFY